MSVRFGIHWLTTRRGAAYASLEDILAALDAFYAEAVAKGHDPYVVGVLRSALCESYARSK